MFQKVKQIIIGLFIIFSILCFGEVSALSISPLKHELTIQKGSSKDEIIKVTNDGKLPLTLYTSREDFVADDDSGKPKFVKVEENKTPELSLTNWIEMTEENITLAPGETRQVKFKVSVPENGEPGGHYGAIFFAPEGKAGQVALIQKLGVLVLINVPGEVKIDGEFKSVEVGEEIDKQFIEKNEINKMPVLFSLLFENTGNIHLKPKGQIEILDENGQIVKNVGKEPIISEQGAFMGEQMVDYIPINAEDGNVLPHSQRRYKSPWEGVAYQVIDEKTGIKKIEFKSLTDFYATEISKQIPDLKFWQQIKTKGVKKKFTANIYSYYEAKDKEKKEYRTSKDFYVKYNETYVGINSVLIWSSFVIIILVIVYFSVIAPKNRKKRETELREQIMKEMKNNKENNK